MSGHQTVSIRGEALSISRRVEGRRPQRALTKKVFIDRVGKVGQGTSRRTERWLFLGDVPYGYETAARFADPGDDYFITIIEVYDDLADPDLELSDAVDSHFTC